MIVRCDHSAMTEGHRLDPGSSARVGQVLGRQTNRHPAVSDGGRDHPRGPGADITDSEDAGPAGLEHQRPAFELCPGIASAQRVIEQSHRKA
jgi:hypothetical protein